MNRFRGLSRGRIAQRGKMNRTETLRAEELQLLKLAGEIQNWWFEPMSLRLSNPPEGQPARYTIDFMILMNDGLTIMEDTKGSGPDNEASIVRIKCAAEQYPLWKFRLVKRKTKKQGGGWKITNV